MQTFLNIGVEFLKVVLCDALSGEFLLCCVTEGCIGGEC